MIIRKLFGTDGIRALANSPLMSVEMATKVGAIIGSKLKATARTKRVLVGKDTRLSSYMLENAISAGLLSSGMDVLLAGTIPTPAVSFLTRSMRCDLGIMISASHNQYQDNGIKLFDKFGEKLSKSVESEIEHAFINCDISNFFCDPSCIGRAKVLGDICNTRYIELAKSGFVNGQDLSGLRVVIDCANGANYKIAPEVLWELGADVIVIGNEPNGKNINHNCGSTFVSPLQEKVIQTRADIGIALDGDGDRVIVVDENGKIADGDEIIAAISTNLSNSNELKSKYIITTIMSNLGLEKYLKSQNLEMVRTDVGDKNVYEAMKKYDSSIGGEQSGHIILRKFCTTGDGLMSGLNILFIMKSLKKTASQVLHNFEKIPQYSAKIEFINKPSKDISKELNKISNTHLLRMKDSRIILRQSGTENIIRITLETTEDNYQTVMDDLKTETIALLQNNKCI